MLTLNQRVWGSSPQGITIEINKSERTFFHMCQIVFPEFETDEARDYFVSRFFIHEHFYDNGDEKEDTTILKCSENHIANHQK